MATTQSAADRLGLLQWLINTQEDEVWSKLADIKDNKVEVKPVVEVKKTEIIIIDHPMTPADVRNELLSGIKDAQEGLLINVNDLMNESQNW
jgi:hypothetical protein